MLFHLSDRQFCSWDLNLVLSILIDLADMSDVSLILVALSCKSYFLIFHKDKVVLRPNFSFLSKVVSVFHLNEDIVLLSLFLGPFKPKAFILHTLDVISVISFYLHATSFFYWGDCCFFASSVPAHSTLSVRAFCAIFHQALVLEICKAITLSSIHTLTTFY